MKKEPSQQRYAPNNPVIIAITLGILLGVVIGIATKSITLGVIVGLIIGLGNALMVARQVTPRKKK